MILFLKLGLSGSEQRRSQPTWIAPPTIAYTPVGAASPQRPRAHSFGPVPDYSFTDVDRRLAEELRYTLPAPIGKTSNPDLLWYARQQMFLTLPENAHIRANSETFKAWERGMQDAVNAAAQRGSQLDHYEIMEAGKARLR